MADVDGSTWKVGQLARLTGLTVRTLHHYHELGLLRPSARTPSGHRLYDEQDVRRLYRIVALRELGLPLEVIGDVLTGEPDLAGLLRDHLTHVDHQLVAVQALRRRLATMVAGVELLGPPSSADLLALMEEVMKMEECRPRWTPAPTLVRQRSRRWRDGGCSCWSSSTAVTPNSGIPFYRMRADNSEMIEQKFGGPTSEQIDYVRQANAASSS